MGGLQAAQNCTRVYKIAPASLWNAAIASGYFAGSADDVRDGFIHLSAAAQISGTLQKYFRDTPDLLLIAFDAQHLASFLRWEASRDGQLFPHYYNPLPMHLALWQRPLGLGAGGIPEFDEESL